MRGRFGRGRWLFDRVMDVNGRGVDSLAYDCVPYLCDGSGNHVLVMSHPMESVLCVGKSADTASKYTMTFTGFDLVQEWRMHRMLDNVL